MGGARQSGQLSQRQVRADPLHVIRTARSATRSTSSEAVQSQREPRSYSGALRIGTAVELPRCAGCCSAEPGRRVVPRRPLAERRGAEPEQPRRRLRLAAASPDGATLALGGRAAAAGPGPRADFCSVGRMQQYCAADDAAGARPLRERRRPAPGCSEHQGLRQSDRAAAGITTQQRQRDRRVDPTEHLAGAGPEARQLAAQLVG